MTRGWLVGFHLIGVVLWMGGLLTFSRVLGYHTKELPSVRPRLTYIEGRLNALVAWPGAVITVATGLWMTVNYGRLWFRGAAWLHFKLALVLVTLAIHVVLTVKHRQILRAHPAQPLSRGLYAALHGIVGLLLIAIVLLATNQPMWQH
jgi:uncharacterized integral membrane protein (TIGR00701 family)